ncbi:MAG TPA: nuclear transport factor 2 family protein [Candidatus Margulisiibacteriota bacterium]|nr:nuclear transport factor 2 family protein [Candidatus Margulisiibacteriota bacterium]
MAKVKKRAAKKTGATRGKAKQSKKLRAVAPAAEPARRQPATAKAARPTRAPAAPPRNSARALAQRIVDLTVTHDDEGCFALYAPNVESIEPGQAPMVGIEAIKQKFAGWRAMAPQSTWRARTICVEGNTIVIEWTGDVTFATGKQATLNEVAVHEVEGGKIVRERFYYDRMAIQP